MQKYLAFIGIYSKEVISEVESSIVKNSEGEGKKRQGKVEWAVSDN